MLSKTAVKSWTSAAISFSTLSSKWRILFDSPIILRKKGPSWCSPRGEGLTTLEAMKEDSRWCEEDRCVCSSSSSWQTHAENANLTILMLAGEEMYEGAWYLKLKTFLLGACWHIQHGMSAYAEEWLFREEEWVERSPGPAELIARVLPLWRKPNFMSVCPAPWPSSARSWEIPAWRYLFQSCHKRAEVQRVIHLRKLHGAFS